MTNHYREELFHLVGEWTDERLDAYILEMEVRLTVTKEMLRELRLIKRRRGKSHKDTGSRSGP